MFTLRSLALTVLCVMQGDVPVRLMARLHYCTFPLLGPSWFAAFFYTVIFNIKTQFTKDYSEKFSAFGISAFLLEEKILILGLSVQ